MPHGMMINTSTSSETGKPGASKSNTYVQPASRIADSYVPNSIAVTPCRPIIT